MEEQIKQILKKELPRMLKETLGSFTNFVVPQHTHNGVDALKIPFKNILVNPDFGMQLLNGSSTSYQIYIIDAQNGSGMVIEPNTGTFGQHGGILYLGGGFSNNSPFLNIDSIVSNGTNTSASTFFPTGFRFTSPNDFAFQLPDTTRPTAIPGMIAFEAGQFYYCITAGVWTPF